MPIELNAGDGGATLATDQVGSEEYQEVKLAFGASGTATIVTSTATNPLPVALSDVDNTVLDNILTAVQLIDNPVIQDDAGFTPASSSVMMVGFEFDDVSPDTVNEGDGGAARMSSRREVYVQLRDAAGNERGLNIDASGKVAVTTLLDGAISGSELQVDVVSGTITANLGATDNAVLDAIQAAVEIIDNAISGSEMQVDIVSSAAIPVTDNSGSLTVDNAALSVTGGGVEATALRVTIASDSTGVLTVDGTVTANLSATDNAVLDAIQAAVEIIDNAISGSEMQVDIVSGTVTANLSATDNAVLDSIDADLTTIIGHVDGVEGLLTTIDADTGGILTAVQILDNAISGSEMQVDVVAALPAGTNNIGDVDVASIAAGTNAIGNVGLIGRTSGGLSIFRSLDLDETEEEVKATAGQVYTIAAFNTTAAPLFLKFYNATAANVTVGTTTPVLTFVVPGNADSDGAGFVLHNAQGWEFGTAITVACTTGVADNDTGAPGANACIVNLGYE